MFHGSSPTPNPSDDELLSAWIDGELADEERRGVEARLEESSAARRRLEEFQAISDALRRLPPQSVDARFHDSVMKAIGAAKERICETESRAPVSAWFHRNVRGLTWSALAVAAALLVMFFSEERPNENREMARRDELPVERDRQPDRAKTIAPLEREELLVADESRAAVRLSARSEEQDLPTNDALDKAADSLGDRPTAAAGRIATPGERAAGGGRFRSPKPTASEPAVSKPTASESAVSESAVSESAVSGPKTPEAGVAAEMGGLGGAAAAGRYRGVQHGYGGGGGFGGGPSRRGGGKAIRDGETETRENRPSAEAVQEKSDTVSSFYYASQAGDAIQRYIDGGAGAVETQQLIEDLEKHTPRGEPLFVVQVDLSPAAVETQAFNQTLLQNRIRLEAQGDEDDGDGGRPPSDAVNHLFSLAAAPGKEVVAVVVEATPAQLHATLNDLQADVRNCVIVDVQSNVASLAAERELYRNGRGRGQPNAKGTDGLSRLADRENKRGRSLAEDDPKRPVAIEETDSKEPSLSQSGQERTDLRLGKKMAGGVAGENHLAIGRDQILGRAWVVQLAPPNPNRDVHLGIATAKEKANSKADAGEPVDPQEDAGLVTKPAGPPFVPQPDSSRQGLPGLQEQTTDRKEPDHLVAADRARAIFLLRMVPSDDTAETAPAVEAEQ